MNCGAAHHVDSSSYLSGLYKRRLDLHILAILTRVQFGIEEAAA